MHAVAFLVCGEFSQKGNAWYDYNMTWFLSWQRIHSNIHSMKWAAYWYNFALAELQDRMHNAKMDKGGGRGEQSIM